MRLGLALWMICAMPSAGCSLMQLGDFGLEPCDEADTGERHSPCRALDRRDGVEDSDCYHWQCRSDGRGCELRPKDSDGDGHADAAVCRSGVANADDCDDGDARRYTLSKEQPDGVDNNCDGVVDEEVLAGRFDPVDELALDLDSRGGVASLQFVRSETASLGLSSLTQRGRATLVDPVAGRLTPIELDSAAAVLRSSGKPCPTRDGLKNCNTRELALAATPPFALGAAVSDDAGCADGELRLGVGSLSDAPLRLWLGGPDAARPSNLHYGVDVSESVLCPPLGIRHPVVASLEQGRETQGLSLWLAESVDAQRSCDAEPQAVDLRAIGLWVVPNERAYLRATDNGSSHAIGRTRGSAGPALISSAELGGYVAAYGNEAGALEILVFDALETQAATRETGVLRVPLPQRFEGARSVDYVALAAPAATSESELRVGAAFRSGCREGATVWFNGFSLRRAQRDLALRSELQLSSHSAAEIIAGPVIVHVATGFLAADEARASRGGWLVSWLTRGEGINKLWAVRISEDWVQLDRLPFEVTSAAIEQLVAYPNGEDRVSYLAVNQNTATLTRGTTLCSAR